MRRFLILILAAFVLSLGGCKKERAEPEREEAVAQGSDASKLKSLGYIGGSGGDAGQVKPAPAPAAKQPPAAIQRKLVRTVDLRLEVKDSPDVAKRVEALVKGVGGYVSSSNAQRQGELMVYTLTLRVPVEHFDQTLNSLRSFAVRIDREHQAVEDVTEQYVDLDAHRRTLEATERELAGLLAESRQKGRKADEIMEIYEKLTEIRTQIEQIQGQINTFDKLAALSTINVELVPTEGAKPVADTFWHPSDTVRSSIRNLIGFLRWLVDFLIYAVIVLVPVLLVIVLAVWLLRWLWRRSGRPFRRLPPPPPPPGPPPGGGPAVP